MLWFPWVLLSIILLLLLLEMQMSRKDKLQWTASMYVEFENMHDKNVWRIVKHADVSHGRKIIGNRSVYALKDDGTPIVHEPLDSVLVRFLVRISMRIMSLWFMTLPSVSIWFRC
jgi:hypothetical protein